MKSGHRQRQTRDVLAQQGFKTRGIVAIELVKHPQLLLMRQPGAVVLHPRHAGFRVDMIRIVGDIGVGKESPQREGKAAIVHRRIFRIVLQPLARVAKVLAKDERLRLGRFCRARNPGDVLKVIPRPARFAEHMHYVQTPAVHIPRRLQPVAHNAVFPAVNLVHKRWRLEIQLRQARVAQPVQRAALLVKAVPVALRRIRVMTCPAHRLVMPIKPRMRIAAVVEHAVRDQAHPSFAYSYASAAAPRRRQTAHQRGDNLRYRICVRSGL